MQSTHIPARAMSLLSVALLLGAGVPLFAASTAEAGARYFEEDWELGSSGWTYSTNQPIAQQDCTSRFAYHGICSVEVNAQMRGQTASASRISTNLQFSGEPGYVISDHFQAEFPFAKSGCARIVQFGSGVKATLNLSYGSGNQIALFLQTPTGAAGTGPLTTPSGQQWMYDQATWYRPILKVDLGTSKLRVEIRAENDTLLATGPAISLPTGSGASIERISYESYYYGNGGLTERPAKCNFDWLQITGPDAPTAPQLLTAIAGPGLGQTTLSWQAPSDDGGVPVLYYNVYRGDSTGSVTTLIGNTTTRSFTAAGMANGEAHYYAARAVNAAGEGAMSNTFLGTTFNVPSAPRGATASWGVNVGEVRLTWQAPASTGGASITNYRIYRGASAGSETFYAQVGNVLAYTDANLPNGTRYYYNVTAVNFVGEGPSSAETSNVPKPDGATFPTALVLRPDPWWSDMARTLNFTYSVAVSQCAPTESCPIAHEWRVYQDGSTTGADGLLLAGGTNTHGGHAETTTFNVSTLVAPTGIDGTHRLKVAVNPREGSTQWRVTSLSFQIGLPQPSQVCDANPGYASYLMPGVGAPNASTRLYPKTYGYKLNGTVSTFRASFADGCPTNGTLGAGDGYYEIGYGGLLLDASATGSLVQLFDSTGQSPKFLLGADNDASGTIGDSALDCMQGPFVGEATVLCSPDASGKIVLLLIPGGGETAPVPTGPVWGRSRICLPKNIKCVSVMYYENLAFQPDSDQDGMSDGFESNMEYMAEQVDHLLAAAQDQEFAKPCGPTPADCASAIRNGDGLTNLEEFRWLTLPIGALFACNPKFSPPCRYILTNARDYDNDSWEDGPERNYWNNKENDPVLNDATWQQIYAAPYDKDSELTFDGNTADYGTVHDRDNDGDGLDDGVEYLAWHSYPEFPDSDCALGEKICSEPGASYWTIHQGSPGTGDRISDSAEKDYWLSLAPGAVSKDWDHDGIRNNLLDPDADGDGVLDAREIHIEQHGLCLGSCTNASLPDTDHDGLLDGANVVLPTWNATSQYFISIGIAHQTLADGNTRFYGEADATPAPTDPLVWDTDNDTLPDGWEVRYGQNPHLQDKDANLDNDGLTNEQEYGYLKPSTWPSGKVYWSGLDANDRDTDEDVLLDGDEVYGVNEYGAATNPFDPDTDHDGLADNEVILYHTDPTLIDTDGDRLSDYSEAIVYRSKRVDPRNPNTDGNNSADGDTLTDYQEIIQYRTDPNDPDTDDDGVPDGHDERPVTYDSPPRPIQYTQVTPIRRESHDGFVSIREEGFADILVTDPHEGEQNISYVGVMLQFTTRVDGVEKVITVHEDVPRADDGAFWGTRVALPDGVPGSHKQLFALSVVTSDGNEVSYWDNDTVHMNPVSWDQETDELDPDGWQSLRSKTTATEVDSPAPGVSMSLTPMSLFDMNISQVFNVFGNFSVHRIRPFSLEPNQTQLLAGFSESNGSLSVDFTQLDVDVAAPETFGIVQTLVMDNGLPVNLSEYGVRNVLNGFERVEPTLDSGPYTASADDGQYQFRSQRTQYQGARKEWIFSNFRKTTPCDGAGFLSAECVAWKLGREEEWKGYQQRQEAVGEVVTAVVQGVIGYTDIQAIRTENAECARLEQEWSANHTNESNEVFLCGTGITNHVLLLLLTFFPLIGMATKFKAATTAVQATDAAMARSIISDEFAAVRAGDRTAETLGRSVTIVEYVRVHPPYSAAAYDLRLGMGSAVEYRATAKNGLEAPVLWSADLGLSTERAYVRDLVREVTHSPTYFEGRTIADATKEFGELTSKIRDHATLSGYNGGTVVADFTDSLVSLDVHEIEGSASLYAKTSGMMLSSATDQGWGYVFEVLQNGKVLQGEIRVARSVGATPEAMSLVEVSADNMQVVVDGRTITANVDAITAYQDGRKVLTEYKAGASSNIGDASKRDLMDRQAGIAFQNWLNDRARWTNELHWRLEKFPPDDDLVSWANYLMGKWSKKDVGNVDIRFFDANGVEWEF